MYHENSATMATPLGNAKKPLLLRRGVRQGDILSPLLFALFINPLLEKLDRSGLGYSFRNNPQLLLPFVAFADDLTLFANSAQELQKMIEIVENFCKNVGMNINYDKCEYTPINTKGKPIVQINGNNINAIPETEATRLLGVFDSKT